MMFDLKKSLFLFETISSGNSLCSFSCLYLWMILLFSMTHSVLSVLSDWLLFGMISLCAYPHTSGHKDSMFLFSYSSLCWIVNIQPLSLISQQVLCCPSILFLHREHRVLYCLCPLCTHSNMHYVMQQGGTDWLLNLIVNMCVLLMGSDSR